MCEAVDVETGEINWRPCPVNLCERADHNHAARVVPLPLDRRAVARRRWRHRFWVAAPALIFAVVVIVLMILFYSGPAPCEPYMNC
jgi:hypothetical protein